MKAIKISSIVAALFFSGLAAAYATARPGLSAALPGVAIAASLVPPLATAGIAVTVGRPWFAVGAALLFVTNIIAIILGAIGLPVEAIGVLMVFDRILDMCRTSINVWGDAACVTIVARLEGEKTNVGIGADEGAEPEPDWSSD